MHRPVISVALLNRMLSASSRPDYRWFAAFQLSAVKLGHVIHAIHQARRFATKTAQSDITLRLDQISDELKSIAAQCEGERLGYMPDLSRIRSLLRDLTTLQQKIVEVHDRLRRYRDRA